ncbi:MAG: SDR family oxidoreductase [Planctomycetota bacterium]
MNCCVVTGGAGFIGSHLVKHLVQDAGEIRVIDDLSTGTVENLNPVMDDIDFFNGSICDASLMTRVCEGASHVFHQAALASVQRSVQNPVATNRVNVEGTLEVLSAAQQNGVERVIYASSSSVYGDSPTLPKSESMAINPKSPYASSKAAGEFYCQNYGDLFELETVSLRYFNVFGPHQDPQSQYAAVIPLFVTSLLNNEPPTIFGDGEQSRDFTFIDDVVRANLLAATSPKAAGKTFNVACGQRYTLNELIDLLTDITHSDIPPTYTDERPGDVRHSQADISRARNILGYSPSVTFEEGLKRTVEYYQNQTPQNETIS